MKFASILFESPEAEILQNQIDLPDFFSDLNLDQIVREIVKDRDEYQLDAYFRQPLQQTSAINYRLEIMRDLENTNLFNALTAFSCGMKKVREYMGFSRSLHYKAQREKWLLDAVFQYCNTLIHLYQDISNLSFSSEGFRLFAMWLADYVESNDFQMLHTETNKMIWTVTEKNSL